MAFIESPSPGRWIMVEGATTRSTRARSTAAGSPRVLTGAGSETAAPRPHLSYVAAAAHGHHLHAADVVRPRRRVAAAHSRARFHREGAEEGGGRRAAPRPGRAHHVLLRGARARGRAGAPPDAAARAAREEVQEDDPQTGAKK